MRSVVAIAAIAAAVVAAAASGASADVPRVQISEQYVAGLSAGAYFSVQYHIAFSAELSGAGIIAGGPFYCAGGNIEEALTACMSDPQLIEVEACEEAASNCVAVSMCDTLDNLKKQRVWLFSGTADTVVKQGVMDKLALFYGNYMPASSIVTEFSKPAEHAWVTNAWGAGCDALGTPYINNCGYDASSAMMESLLGRSLRPPVTANQTAFFAIDQGQHTPLGVAPALLSMGPTAYAYVPDACNGGRVACPLVTVFHGCQQTFDDIGHDFIQHTGMAQMAEANGFVVLFPQVIKTFPLNPKGCWDWTGYTSPDYATQQGPQMQTVKRMVDSIIAGNP